MRQRQLAANKKCAEKAISIKMSSGTEGGFDSAMTFDGETQQGKHPVSNTQQKQGKKERKKENQQKKGHGGCSMQEQGRYTACMPFCPRLLAAGDYAVSGPVYKKIFKEKPGRMLI